MIFKLSIHVYYIYYTCFQNVYPDPRKQCGPYKPRHETVLKKDETFQRPNIDGRNHDTIGMVAIDIHRDIAVATSTNGASHKIPGLVNPKNSYFFIFLFEIHPWNKILTHICPQSRW